MESQALERQSAHHFHSCPVLALAGLLPGKFLPQARQLDLQAEKLETFLV